MRLFRAALRVLRAPRTALAVLAFQAAYAASALWLPLRFSSAVFLSSVVLLFGATFACTWERTRATIALWLGSTRGGGHELRARPHTAIRSFLLESGFRGRGETMFRYRPAIWGGWLLHVGVLALIFGVLLQQTLHESGAFELTEGERTRLSDRGVVIGHQAGAFASKTPPPIVVTLLAFDPFYHQRGYAPDRASRIAAGGHEYFVDRAKGVEASGVTFYQAIPTSIAINLSIPSMGLRSIHLRRESENRAAADIKDISGRRARIVAFTERPLDDRDGTGAIDVELHRSGSVTRIEPRIPFDFGGEPVRLVSIGRWAGFTYSRSPGVPLVFGGFGLILLGSALLAFPSGFARIAADGSATVYMKRGGALLLETWAEWSDPSTEVAIPPVETAQFETPSC
ncbi:MAG: hypothetical protein ACYC7A_08905 [Thermoanaerobaculia bacterium]